MDCPDAVKQEESQEAVKPRLIVTWSAKRYAHDMKELNLQWGASQKNGKVPAPAELMPLLNEARDNFEKSKSSQIQMKRRRRAL